MANNLIGIIGAGKSGVSSCKLALKFGYKVILSDISEDKEVNIKENSDLIVEIGEHSDKLLDCEMLIISPGIPTDIDIVNRAINRDIPIIHFHGTSDGVVNYYPPSFDGALTIQESVQFWSNYNNLTIESYKSSKKCFFLLVADFFKKINGRYI